MQHKWNVPTPKEKLKLGKLTASITEEQLTARARKNVDKYMTGNFEKDYDFLTEIPNEEDSHTAVNSPRPKRKRKSSQRDDTSS